MTSSFRYFVAVSPGLEEWLRRELQSLGIESSVTPGGVECQGPVEVLWALHHDSRLAESVRLRLHPFRARDFAELERGLERLPWHAYLRANAPYRVAVTTQQSRLYHTEAVAERVRRVVENRRKKSRIPQERAPGALAPKAEMEHAEPALSAVEQGLHVRIVRDIVQVSVDASGDRLHRRGYRKHVGDAPLRETLAAAAIRLLEASAPEVHFESLWDPCCGSGTLLCEWLLMRTGRGSARGRRFAFEDWPVHVGEKYVAWQLSKRSATATSSAEPTLRAFGSDIDERAIHAARHNLELAGVLPMSDLLDGDFRHLQARIPKGTAVISNLPYGIRIADRKSALRTFLSLDRILRQRSDLRPALVLTTSKPPPQVAQSWECLAEFANGGLRVRALSFHASPQPPNGIVETAADPVERA